MGCCDNDLRVCIKISTKETIEKLIKMNLLLSHYYEKWLTIDVREEDFDNQCINVFILLPYRNNKSCRIIQTINMLSN